METITLEQLIEEGKDIRKTISYIKAPSGVIRMYAAYSLADNSKYEIWKNKSIRFLSEVKLLDNFAVREGVLAFKGWKLKPGIYNPDGTLKHSALTDSDFRPDLQQKGVDTKIGLDLAWISYEKICNNVILVTGDSDFVPAIKTARRNGVFVTLYTLNHAIMPLLRENVDILNTTKIDDLINVTNATN